MRRVAHSALIELCERIKFWYGYDKDMNDACRALIARLTHRHDRILARWPNAYGVSVMEVKFLGEALDLLRLASELERQGIQVGIIDIWTHQFVMVVYLTERQRIQAMDIHRHWYGRVIWSQAQYN